MLPMHAIALHHDGSDTRLLLQSCLGVQLMEHAVQDTTLDWLVPLAMENAKAQTDLHLAITLRRAEAAIFCCWECDREPNAAVWFSRWHTRGPRAVPSV